jgi:hypothetical protein
MKKFKTRREKLKEKIEFELKSSNPNITKILDSVDDYEKDNLGTIKNLKREKTVTLKKINGGLKSAIDAHGPITKLLIGSASKRIHGALLSTPVEKKISKNKRNNELLRIILEISAILYILFTLWK